MFGVNLDPLNPAGCPDPNTLAALGFTWVRMVARPGIEGYHFLCRSAGLKTLVVLARESFDLEPYELDGRVSEQAYSYANALNATAYQVGNEPDADGPSSWTMTPEDYERLAVLASAGIRGASARATVIGAGLASGLTDWIERLGRPLPFDALACHPYNKDPDQARDLLRRTAAAGDRLPVWVTEWNRPVEQIRPFVAMLREEAEVAMWFCWSNGMVPGFGLVEAEGAPRAEYYALKEAIGPMATILDAQAQAYQLANPSTPVNPEAAIFRKWLELKAAGQLIGVPIGPEISLEDGTAAQAFTSGAVLHWKGGSEVEVL